MSNESAQWKKTVSGFSDEILYQMWHRLNLCEYSLSTDGYDHHQAVKSMSKQSVDSAHVKSTMWKALDNECEKRKINPRKPWKVKPDSAEFGDKEVIYTDDGIDYDDTEVSLKQLKQISEMAHLHQELIIERDNDGNASMQWKVSIQEDTVNVTTIVVGCATDSLETLDAIIAGHPDEQR